MKPIGDKKQMGEKPPVGPCAAILIGVFDIGWQEGFQGKPTEKVLYLYETEHRYKMGDYKDKRILKSEKFSQSLYDGTDKNGRPRGKPAGLFLRIKGMKGTAPAKPYDPEQDVGLPVLLNLAESDDKEYVDIQSVMPCPPNMVIQRETPVDYVPDWIKKLIEEGHKTKEWTPEAEDHPVESTPPPPSVAPLTPIGESRKRANDMLTVLHPMLPGTKYKELWEEREKSWGDKPSLDFLVDVKWKGILDRLDDK